jgi:YHS domain-containing protein
MQYALLTILFSACGLIAADKPADKPAKPYPLDKCIVSDEKLGVEGKPVVFVHEGQEIKPCCQDCRKDFDANSAKYLAKLPKAETKSAGAEHKTCACCAGDAKAADGKPAAHDHGAEAKPADKGAKPHDHDHASAKPTETPKDAPAKPYPLKTCIVSDNDLDSMGEQASFVYQGQTIKVCCKACIAKFEKNPAKYLKKLEGK